MAIVGLVDANVPVSSLAVAAAFGVAVLVRRYGVAVAVLVRAAGVDDLDSLVALRRAWANEDGHVEEPGFEQRFADWFHREASRRRFWLAEDDGTPVGFANLLVFDRMPNPGARPGGWGYLGNMYVAPSHRNAGVGSLILATITEYADALGLERIVLNPSARSVGFYERAGFISANSLMLRPSEGHERSA